MSTSATPLVGGRYEIIRTLGQGSFGHTFLARDLAGDRSVAIKVLDARSGKDAKAYELFRREAEVLAAVRHHGIPEVYETLQDTWNGTPAAFLVMEYIEGASLAEIITERRVLDGADVVHLFLELLGILDYLHGRVPPILHRDIKPSNIIVRPNGFPTLVDFGSVRRVYMGPEESGSTVAGTYGYMPYEQYMGQATPASDLFATAATFLHLLTGRPPRDFMSDEGRIDVPESLPGEPRLRAVIARLLRHAPAERFASAREVRNALVGPTTLTVSTPPTASATLAPYKFSEPLDDVLALPPAPRPLTGATAQLMRDASPSTLRFMTASEKREDYKSIGGIASLTFFSMLTMGVLPIVFLQIASARRRRMKRFFRDGTPGVATIVRVEVEKSAFDEHMTRVAYEFEADGALHRDTDSVIRVIGDRWRAGDRVPILYIAGRSYDSVIVAVE